VVFIAIMTYVSYRGIVISERIQAGLVTFQFAVLILLSVLALSRVFNGSAGPQAVCHPSCPGSPRWGSQPLKSRPE
jgi:amino acid transporter